MNTLGKNKKSERPARSDDFDIKIYNSKSEVVSEGYGCWLSHLIIDDNLKWRIEDPLPKWSAPGAFNDGTKILESDTSRRLDVPPMINKDWEEAE